MVRGSEREGSRGLERRDSRGDLCFRENLQSFPIDFRRGIGGLPARRKLEGGERRIKTEQPTNRTNPIPRHSPRNPHNVPRNLFPTRERKTIPGSPDGRGRSHPTGTKENAVEQRDGRRSAPRSLAGNRRAIPTA